MCDEPEDRKGAMRQTKPKTMWNEEVPSTRRAAAYDSVHCDRARLRCSFSARSCATSASQLREVGRPASAATMTVDTVIITSTHAFDGVVGGTANCTRKGTRTGITSRCECYSARPHVGLSCILGPLKV